MDTTPTNTALLVMDMQEGILQSLPADSPIIGNVVKAIAHARSAGMPVIYVVVGFRPGMPEISTHNKGFSAIKERMAGVDIAKWMTVLPELAPKEGELTVVKRRISAFTGSDLKVVLRAKEVRNLVLTGVATSGVVLSTYTEASDKDLSLSVLSDCCWDADEEVYRVLTTKIFRRADVLAVAEWINK